MTGENKKGHYLEGGEWLAMVRENIKNPNRKYFDAEFRRVLNTRWAPEGYKLQEGGRDGRCKGRCV